MKRYPTNEEIVEYGLEKVDSERTIEVNLRDFLYLHNTLAEFVRFFHQPMHYESLADVDRFLGNRKSGGYHTLSECLYKKFYYEDVFPDDIVEMIINSEFENPFDPFYYENKSNTPQD